ncbi:MAG TPA: polyprenyl synthetase family protein, partial [Propionibacteriaceae bacterium]
MANPMASGILAAVPRSADDASHTFDAAARNGCAEMPAVDNAAALSAAVDVTLSDFLAREALALESADPALGGLASLARSYVLACGKRLRPTFAHWGWRGVAGLAPPLEAVLPALAGLELLHAFALVQDDVMDGSTTRR